MRGVEVGCGSACGGECACGGDHLGVHVELIMSVYVKECACGADM